MVGRELAKPEDRPLSIVIGPTASQQDQIEYRENEVARLQKENQDLRSQVDKNEALARLVSLECPHNRARKITILECVNKRKRGDCVKRHCIPRSMLLAKINL